MENLGFLAYPAIVVIAFLLCQALKALNIDNKWIPVFAGVTGGLLGIVAYQSVADFPATDLLSAIATGIVSGFAATGIHQVYKQIKE